MKSFLKKILIKIKQVTQKQFQWEYPDAAGDKLRVKKYSTYDEYVTHQKSKLKTVANKMLPEYDKRYRETLRERLEQYGFVKGGERVLCLAARIGTEVKSFIDLKCFAIGIDLNPGENNQFVLSGDFHNLVFSDSTVDIVFTNSLDHAFDIQKVIGEAKRVLKNNGLFILEIVNGEDEGYQPGYWESVSWKRTADIIKLFETNGFNVQKEEKFNYPWNGKHFVLKKEAI